MPLHWACVWDPERGFYRRSDISVLRENYAIQLGHGSGICLNPQSPIKFIITHSNGIHGTRVSFCNCFGSGTRIEQLMRAKLFPGSKTEPISAFSFGMLKEYDILSLQGKVSAYDYYLFLRRITDNVFTHLVNDLYQTFMRIVRVYRFLKANLRLGQVHGIDEFFPHRPEGGLVVYCPSCPRPGENMRGEWWRTPRMLRHLIQWRVTEDGNHQVAQYFKNTDPFDQSIYSGRSYFPEVTEYKEFLKSRGTISDEEYAAHCNHVKVIANQGRIQNQNCAKTGVVNTQCDHVFVMASTDMVNGEGWPVVDASLHHGFRLQGFGDGKTDNHRQSVLVTHCYDAECSYSVHHQERFASSEYLCDQKEFVRKFEYGIPDLHIKGHQDDCHFHGETAEFYWVELNQVGGYTRQMNDGHREETITAHHNDWNHRKMINAAELTAQALQYARTQAVTKTRDFKQLSLVNPQAAEWSRLSREPRLEQFQNGKKYYTSVYHRRPQAAPTVKALLNHLSAKDAITADLGGVDPSSVEIFFRKAFDIERLQLEIRDIKRRNRKDPDAMSIHDKEELEGRTRRLQKALKELRSRRAEIMPSISTIAMGYAVKQDAMEEEKLFLPSDFSPADRIQYNLSAIAREEVLLREAQADEEITKVKTVAKAIDSILQFRSKEIRTQDAKTRSERDVATTFVRRDRHITAYNHARRALINLGVIDPTAEESPYPLLKPEDTHRHNVNIKRRLGDSKRREGLLWTVGAASDLLAKTEPNEELLVGLDQDLVPIPLVTPTQMTQRASAPAGPRKKEAEHSKSTENPIPAFPINRSEDDSEGLDSDDSDKASMQGEDTKRKAKEKKEKKFRKDSWLWTKGTRNMTPDEIQQWELEGDRIQWFRAEAEMYRWMEQFESKHA
ncbi:hypothetical protein F5880DRAFT_1512414, partial [Lentinula raphanica]